MRKTALSLSLLFALIAGCMVGCNDVKSKKVDGKEVLFTVGDTNVFADDLLGFEETKLTYDFLTTDDGVKAVYEAVYKALAQKNVEVTSAIEGAVKEKMDNWDDEVAAYASENGVTTRNAEKTKLEELGYEDRKELEASYVLAEQKDELASQFKSDRTEPTTTSTKGESMLEKYVNNTSPMIVKHVLVKVADSSSLTSKAEVTESESDKLTTVMERFALGKASRNTFRNIAVEESDDTSATNGGHLGIVDSYTSFVPEFKLGLYVSEMVQNKAKTGGYDTADTLGAKDFTTDLFGANGVYANYSIDSIDIGVIGSVLSYVADDKAADEQTAAGHLKTSEYDSKLFPRNVIYNKYFNYPGIQYIKLDVPSSAAGDLTNVKASIKNVLKEVYPSITDDAALNTKVDAVIASDYFQNLLSTNQKVDQTTKYVLDDNNSPIVLAKSDHGFHFMSISWSSLDQAVATTGTDDSVKYFMYGTNAPTTGTYVKTTDYNFGYTTSTVGQNTRKTEIENRISNYVKGGFEGVEPSEELNEYEIFNYYLGTSEVSIPNTTLKKAVEDYIDLQITYKAAKINEAQDNSWSDYIEAIQANQEMRDLLY